MTSYALNVEENNDLLLIPGQTRWMVFPLIISQILKLVSQHFLYNRAPKAAQNEDTGGQMQNESLLDLFNRLTTTQQHHLAK